MSAGWPGQLAAGNTAHESGYPEFFGGSGMVPIREPKTYSVLLADDLTLVREGLAALCQAQPGYRVVGQCSEGAAALRQIEAMRPDIAVLDLNLPDLFT